VLHFAPEAAHQKICASKTSTQHHEEHDWLGVLVVDCVTAALKWCETLVSLNLRPAKTEN
jgi:hypothetical protein